MLPETRILKKNRKPGLAVSVIECRLQDDPSQAALVIDDLTENGCLSNLVHLIPDLSPTATSAFFEIPAFRDVVLEPLSIGGPRRIESEPNDALLALFSESIAQALSRQFKTLDDALEWVLPLDIPIAIQDAIVDRYEAAAAALLSAAAGVPPSPRHQPALRLSKSAKPLIDIDSSDSSSIESSDDEYEQPESDAPKAHGSASGVPMQTQKITPAAAASSQRQPITSDSTPSDHDEVFEEESELDAAALFNPDAQIYGNVDIPTPQEHFDAWHSKLNLNTWKAIQEFSITYKDPDSDPSSWAKKLDKLPSKTSMTMDLPPVPRSNALKARREQWGDEYDNIAAHEKEQFRRLPALVKECCGDNAKGARHTGDIYIRRFWAPYIYVNSCIVEKNDLVIANNELAAYTFLRFSHLKQRNGTGVKLMRSFFTTAKKRMLEKIGDGPSEPKVKSQQMSRAVSFMAGELRRTAAPGLWFKTTGAAKVKEQVDRRLAEFAEENRLALNHPNINNQRLGFQSSETARLFRMQSVDMQEEYQRKVQEPTMKAEDFADVAAPVIRSFIDAVTKDAGGFGIVALAFDTSQGPIISLSQHGTQLRDRAWLQTQGTVFLQPFVQVASEAFEVELGQLPLITAKAAAPAEAIDHPWASRSSESMGLPEFKYPIANYLEDNRQILRNAILQAIWLYTGQSPSMNAVVSKFQQWIVPETMPALSQLMIDPVHMPLSIVEAWAKHWEDSLDPNSGLQQEKRLRFHGQALHEKAPPLVANGEDSDGSAHEASIGVTEVPGAKSKVKGKGKAKAPAQKPHTIKLRIRRPPTPGPDDADVEDEDDVIDDANLNPSPPKTARGTAAASTNTTLNTTPGSQHRRPSSGKVFVEITRPPNFDSKSYTPAGFSSPDRRRQIKDASRLRSTSPSPNAAAAALIHQMASAAFIPASPAPSAGAMDMDDDLLYHDENALAGPLNDQAGDDDESSEASQIGVDAPAEPNLSPPVTPPRRQSELPRAASRAPLVPYSSDPDSPVKVGLAQYPRSSPPSSPGAPLPLPIDQLTTPANHSSQKCHSTINSGASGSATVAPAEATRPTFRAQAPDGTASGAAASEQSTPGGSQAAPVTLPEVYPTVQPASNREERQTSNQEKGTAQKQTKHIPPPPREPEPASSACPTHLVPISLKEMVKYTFTDGKLPLEYETRLKKWAESNPWKAKSFGQFAIDAAACASWDIRHSSPLLPHLAHLLEASVATEWHSITQPTTIFQTPIKHRIRLLLPWSNIAAGSPPHHIFELLLNPVKPVPLMASLVSQGGGWSLKDVGCFARGLVAMLETAFSRAADCPAGILTHSWVDLLPIACAVVFLRYSQSLHHGTGGYDGPEGAVIDGLTDRATIFANSLAMIRFFSFMIASPAVTLLFAEAPSRTLAHDLGIWLSECLVTVSESAAVAAASGRSDFFSFSLPETLPAAIVPVAQTVMRHPGWWFKFCQGKQFGPKPLEIETKNNLLANQLPQWCTDLTAKHWKGLSGQDRIVCGILLTIAVLQEAGSDGPKRQPQLQKCIDMLIQVQFTVQQSKSIAECDAGPTFKSNPGSVTAWEGNRSWKSTQTTPAAALDKVEMDGVRVAVPLSMNIDQQKLQNLFNALGNGAPHPRSPQKAATPSVDRRHPPAAFTGTPSSAQAAAPAPLIIAAQLPAAPTAVPEGPVAHVLQTVPENSATPTSVVDQDAQEALELPADNTQEKKRKRSAGKGSGSSKRSRLETAEVAATAATAGPSSHTRMTCSKSQTPGHPN
ncbi:hypothetical protein M407DRAFT_31740 [Tulasnella calospora MUT 4182]|uniref:Uncharacterized protein n=1 Tax=Tulasnella calospora MUT 4182 TaxID=1051891 RepID=A0A0C3LAS7_9AGAM|nr:hypothetical protein M407DRAFT_31740 [Tulasnella calospora MUT 4182]